MKRRGFVEQSVEGEDIREKEGRKGTKRGSISLVSRNDEKMHLIVG